MSYVDCDSYDQNVSPYLRRRLRTYDEALSERQAASLRASKRATLRPQPVGAGNFLLRDLPGPASRPAPHDVQSAVAA